METIETLSTTQVQLITPVEAWHYKIIPSNKNTFFCSQSSSIAQLKEELEMIWDRKIALVPISDEALTKALNTYYRKSNGSQTSSSTGQNYTGGSDNFLPFMIAEARNLRSSDIHIEVYDAKCRVRIRIDGMLVERFKIDKNEYPSIINKIKIMSQLDIAEKRLPQDGRIFFNKEGMKFDIRVSVLPTLHGEKVVMRLLSNDSTNIDIEKLGFEQEDLDNYLEGIRKPNGILLISGPTGSGKTTTLYATLKLLNKESRNIVTIEDPIEYTLEGINQVQLKEVIGLTFSSALRSFLRQDPDVIMVGEIRDTETATMAIRASLTGHLVLSTIHTNSAWGTISRLIDMGVPPFLVANTLNTSVAQRLVRLLCDECKEQQPFESKLYPKHFTAPRHLVHHHTPKGCASCHYTGYKGRKAVYEVIPIDKTLSDQIKNNNMQVDAILAEKGIKTLSQNAFELFENGKTSLEEIYSLLFA